MYKTHKKNQLKYFVSIAMGVFTLGLQSQAFALGLNEINVNSYLGQPLKASVGVLGANELKASACLGTGSNSDLKNVSLKLGPISGDKATLFITSPQAVNEPIVNLSIVAGCGITIERNYVILLDPPLSTFGTDINSPIVQKVDTSDGIVSKPSAAESAEPAPKSVKKTTSKAKRKKKINHNRFANKKSTKAKKTQTSQIARVYVEENEPTAQDGKDRLSISGGSQSYAYSGNTGLRLERRLRFKPDPNAPVIQDVELDDEITVMNNRLKHLQEQITKLQKQNNALQSDNKFKTEQLAKAESKTGFLSVLPYLAGLLLLTGAYAAWQQRRKKAIKKESVESAWHKANERAEPTSPAEKAIVKKKKQPDSVAHKEEAQEEVEANENANENEGLFDDVNINFGLGDDSKESLESHFEASNIKEPAILVDDEEAFSVLDHADVFLSHGRSTLAIQLLQNHLLDHPKQSVTIWLFLLDLLEKEKLQTVYEEAATECKLHFNVEIADYSEEANDVELSDKNSLEDFPHLAKGLEKVWGTSAALVFLDDLIYNNRLEPRAGLPKKVFEELVLLRSMAQEGVNTADVIHLDAKVDEKKLAMKEQKEALLESNKAEKLKAIAEAERKAKEKANKDAGNDDETDFEFTLAD